MTTKKTTKKKVRSTTPKSDLGQMDLDIKSAIATSAKTIFLDNWTSNTFFLDNWTSNTFPLLKSACVSIEIGGAKFTIPDATGEKAREFVLAMIDYWYGKETK